jgi:hypothetical protein
MQIDNEILYNTSVPKGTALDRWAFEYTSSQAVQTGKTK